MAETTPSHRPFEPYLPISTAPGPVEPMREIRALEAERTPSVVVEASALLLDAQQLLQESRTAEAEQLLLRALELYERQDKIPADCVQVLSDLASIATTRGDLIAAESHLRRALALVDVRFGANHPDVAAILAGLARLYLRRGEFTKAEPLLQRLLGIKRARGDEHPEVATVLATIATVHSAMGAHESAERILRRVLAIRERALAPNHFATMTTFEHLAESCAARGKFEEALTLLHRALAMRERTLGVSHPSIAAARTHIADLELLSSNEELGSVPTLASVMATLPAIEARVDEPVASDAPPPEDPVVSDPLRLVRDQRYAERYDEWDDDVEVPRRKRQLLDQLGAKAGLVTGFAQTPRGRVTVLAIGIASLLAALVLAVRTRADVAVTSADASIISTQSASSKAPRTDGDVALEPNLIAHPASAPASARLTRSDDVAPIDRRATASARGFAPPATVAKEPESIALPKAPKVGAFDALVAGVPIAPVRAPLVASAEFTPSRPSPTEQAMTGGAIERARRLSVHAMLPTNNPAPAYPADLIRRGIEGRVVAEFLVNAKGRVDPRTLRIISSTDERFSQAVRDVLPSLQFVPAESDGVKIEEWVKMPFRFAPKPK